ncbi:sodium- and chloride-dependent GABA transporter 2-like isoform X2, partial [Dinothrombium tinctorium]
MAGEKKMVSVPNSDKQIKSESGLRGEWGSSAEFFLACLGNMVGVGNILRFPFLVYRNGGGAFLIPYLISMFTISIPILLMETLIGQYAKRGPVEAFKNMFPLFQGLGFTAIIACATLSTSYNMLIGWTVFYLSEVFTQEWTHCNHTYNTPNCVTLDEMRTNPNLSRFSGHQTLSTEEFFKGITLEGAFKGEIDFASLHSYFDFQLGIAYYVTPDLNKLLEISVWTDALIAIFFSLGVGMGCMVVYGSYNKFHNKLVRDVVFVILGDVLTSIFAGFVVFSMVGYVSQMINKEVGDVVENGRSLAFTVILGALSTLPGSSFWSFCFFFGLLTLGIDSQFAFVETVISYFYDRQIIAKKKPRHALVSLLYGFGLFAFSLPFATSVGIYLFEMYENYCAGLSVIFSAILECILVGAVYGTDNLLNNLTFMTGVRFNKPIRCIFHVLYCFILPALLSFLLVNGFIGLINESFQGELYGVKAPWWALLWSWSLILLPLLCVP